MKDVGQCMINKFNDGLNYEKKRCYSIVASFENPYPKDIFQWNNDESLEFNRGRFNQHCFEIVENMRESLLKKIMEE